MKNPHGRVELADAAQPVRRVRVSARAVQIGLGLIWLVDGLLQLQPKMFGIDFAKGVILPTAQGQPGVVSSAITHMAHLISLQPAVVDLGFASVQLLIGIGLLIPRMVRPALVVSFGWAFGVWTLGEGFGMLLTGSASPLTGAPGAALLYAVIGVLVWPGRDGRANASGSAASEGPLGAWGGTAVWAMVWSGMGVLWLLPANRATGSVSTAISGAVTGEPGWLANVQLTVAHALGGDGVSLAVACGVLSFVIGLGPLLSRRSTPFLMCGAVLAISYWVFGEAFGQIFSGLATDPNSGPLLVLLALTVYPNRATLRAGPALRVQPSRMPTVTPATAGAAVASTPR